MCVCVHRKREREREREYCRIASDSTDPTGDKWDEVSDRSAEIVIPGRLALLLIEVMKSRLLC